jgi:hypothetical protein
MTKIKLKLEPNLLQKMIEYSDVYYVHTKVDERLNIFIEHLIIQAYTRFNPILDYKNIHKIKLKSEQLPSIIKIKGDDNFYIFLRKQILNILEKSRIEQ